MTIAWKGETNKDNFIDLITKKAKALYDKEA